MIRRPPTATSLQRRARPPAGGSRREILNAAAKLLRTHGYHATTLRDIAEAVGIKAASIYYHFGSKDEIAEAVIVAGVELVEERVKAALADLATAAPGERLEAAVRAHLDALHEHGDYTSASTRAFASVPAPVRERTRPVRRRYEDIWRGLVAELADAGLLAPGAKPSAVRLMLLGAMNFTPDWYRAGGLTTADLAATFARTIVHR